MPRRNSIKWRQVDDKRLSNAVRNFNSKIRRLLKKNPELSEVLPSSQSVKNIKRDIKTRAEYNSYLRSLQSFTKRGAEKLVTNRNGVVLTKYELSEIRKRVRRINKQRAKEVIIADPSPYRGNMGSIQEYNLRPKKFDWANIDKKNFPSFRKSVYHQSRFSYSDDKLRALKENYIKGLYAVFNSGADDIVAILEQIPEDKFKENLYRNPLLTVEFIYDPIESEMKAQAIHDNWESVLDGL